MPRPAFADRRGPFRLPPRRRLPAWGRARACRGGSAARARGSVCFASTGFSRSLRASLRACLRASATWSPRALTTVLRLTPAALATAVSVASGLAGVGRKHGKSPAVGLRTIIPRAGVKILLQQYPATADIRLMTSLPRRCFGVFLTPFRGNPDGHGKVPVRPYRPNKVDQGTRRYTNASTRLPPPGTLWFQRGP